VTNVRSVTEYKFFLPKTFPKTFSYPYIGKIVDGSKASLKPLEKLFKLLNTKENLI